MKILCVRLLQFIVTASLLSACGGGGGGSSGSTASNPSRVVANSNSVDSVFRPALSDSFYKNELVDCVVIVKNNPVKSCKLNTLPFIGQFHSMPTKADILAQTVVSHPWMAARFEQALDHMPQDILLLFRGVTAVVIGADIRPSHYRSDTGAIYLDPANLWLIASERNSISRQEDYRSGFSNGLAFRTLWRYVQGNRDAFGYYPLDGAITTREITDITLPFADLLFHELAHANDFMPPAFVAQVDSQMTPSEAIAAFSPSRVSSQLTAYSPLNSQMQKELAQVMYRGATATDLQKQLSPEQVGLDFSIDGANDSYNYSSQYEDTAMLFEEVMMNYYFSVDRQVAFSDAPPASGATCADYVVRWGVKNRIGDPLVRSRVKMIVGKLLGKENVSDYFLYLPYPTPMKSGVDWCHNYGNAFSQGEIKSEKTSGEPVPEWSLLPID